MKICPKCKNENNDHAKFCVGCGGELSSSTSSSDKNNIFRKPLVWIILLLAIGGVVLSQLGIIGDDITTYLIASKKEVVFLKPGGTERIDIDTDGRKWKIAHTPDWCSVDKRDNNFTIKCTKNNSSETRTGWITIISGQYNIQIDIGQYGIATHLNISEYSIKADSGGGTFEIEVETDGDDWGVNYPSNICEVETYRDNFEIIFKDNTNFGRNGTITVSSDNQKKYISFYQKGKCRSCNGNGSTMCYWCGGTGRTMSGVGWYGDIQYSNCSSCGGQRKNECTSCDGYGWE